MCIPRFKAFNFQINLTHRNKIHHGKKTNGNVANFSRKNLIFMQKQFFIQLFNNFRNKMKWNQCNDYL